MTQIWCAHKVLEPKFEIGFYDSFAETLVSLSSALPVVSQWSKGGWLWSWHRQGTCKRALLTHHGMTQNNCPVGLPSWNSPWKGRKREVFQKWCCKTKPNPQIWRFYLLVFWRVCCMATVLNNTWAGALSTFVTAVCSYLLHGDLVRAMTLERRLMGKGALPHTSHNILCVSSGGCRVGINSLQRGF